MKSNAESTIQPSYTQPFAFTPSPQRDINNKAQTNEQELSSKSSNQVNFSNLEFKNAAKKYCISFPLTHFDKNYCAQVEIKQLMHNPEELKTEINDHFLILTPSAL